MAGGSATYASLRSAVGKLLREGEEAGASRRITRYYSIGEMIEDHILQHAERADYGREVIQRLT